MRKQHDLDNPEKYGGKYLELSDLIVCMEKETDLQIFLYTFVSKFGVKMLLK